ncbi:hypothetical protein JG688_00003953 [Phytophthora aleatoria]|uniref:Secreted protein n=1 Tax=Phytophthora aleatoria TaxID=2496075 RepID=A0A8J5JA11_9STRA|nr:hypothetical protein JG688_00003953 [Phytophthora aleatoria]
MNKISLSLLLSSIPLTSNFVERFSSVARTTNGQERHTLQPITLEMVLSCAKTVSSGQHRQSMRPLVNHKHDVALVNIMLLFTVCSL